MPSKGLGKSFDVLIPKGIDVDSVAAGIHEKVHQLSIDTVVPKKEQPRQTFEEAALQELANSIVEHGIIQPLIVSQNEQNIYSIIAGERRWRAAQMVGLKEVPAIIRTANEHEQLEIALLENVQRADLTALELALTIEKLHTQFNQDYSQIAKRLGKAYTTIMNVIRLLALPQKAQLALQQGQITEGHARSILALQKYPDKQNELLELIIKNKWTVRQAEQFVVAVKKGSSDSTNVSAKKQIVSDQHTKKIQKYLGAKNVLLHKSVKGSGKIIIFYDTEKDLDGIINKMLKR